MWSATHVPDHVDHKLTAIWWRGKQSVELNIWAIAGTGRGCLGGFWLWPRQSNAEQKLSVSAEGTLLPNLMISWRTEMKRSIEEGEVNKETGLKMKVGPHEKTWTPLEPLHLWPSLKSQRDETFVSDSESLTSVRQQDIISYFSEPRWHKFQLPTSYFLKPAASREVSQGGKSHWQSAPRCPHSSFAFKSNIL